MRLQLHPQRSDRSPPRLTQTPTRQADATIFDQPDSPEEAKRPAAALLERW